MAIYPTLLNWIVILASSCVLGGIERAPTTTESKEVRFIALGDMPYSKYEGELLRTELRDAIAEADVPFVIHYGDFKPGNASCTDELFEQTHQDIVSLHARVFYTPGDNEWTDCDRSGLTEPKSELERLDTLRTLFFSEEPVAQVSRQSQYPENARWWQDGVLFSTLHIVGTDNGRTQILKDDVPKAIARVEARDQANARWLDAAFAEAQEKNAEALVLVMQADISKGKGDQACSEAVTTDCNAYFNIQNQLTTQASQFLRADQTQKPVLLVHGDTFPFCWDKTFGGETAPNLWRLNAWGDFQQPSDVTAIAFQPTSKEPFVAQTLVNQVDPKICSAD